MRPLTLFLQIQAEASKPYERPVMTNIHRSDYVEAIVSVALREHGWRRMTPWDSWDFQHETGCRLEVKQSAARQSWEQRTRQTVPRFDTAPRTGYWDGATWIPEPGRHAHIYLFAWHDDPSTEADQRDPATWVFHVIPEQELPGQKTIGLAGIKARSSSCSFAELGEAVSAVQCQLQRPEAP